VLDIQKAMAFVLAKAELAPLLEELAAVWCHGTAELDQVGVWDKKVVEEGIMVGVLVPANQIVARNRQSCFYVYKEKVLFI